ncbi:putative nuclease HARBI1 [Argopecten irradians]|uniref:putative nuclease HARBI1 n=1 Tax=Argopecten irradians TaxID=31199 RepID=UPI0037153CCA
MAILVLRRDQDVPKRLFRDKKNPLDYLNDAAVISDYRLDRQSIYAVCDSIKENLERQTKRSMALPVSLQVMIALRFYASGSYMSVIAEAHGVSKMAVSRAVKIVTDLIVGQSNEHIVFPMNRQDQLTVKQNFYNIRGFPSVLGAVDGSLIPIETPSTDEYHYVCRKGFHALNIQGVCDAKLKFLYIVAKWPGSTHDSLTPADRKYNVCHKATRCVIERAFGLWKMRFRFIYRPLHLAPERAVPVVIATAVLHNICVEKGLPLPESDDDEDSDENGNAIYRPDDTANGTNVREELINRVFS